MNKRVLYDRRGVSVTLSHYRPDSYMPAHTHAYHQLSCLLSGEMREDGPSRERDILRPSVGIKPAGFSHANEYGPHGSLILAVNLDPDTSVLHPETSFDDWRWSANEAGLENAGETAQALGRLLTSTEHNAEAAVWDLLALSPQRDEIEHGHRPSWLDRVREALRDTDGDLDMNSLAAEAGVHRVHLSRTFRRWFGLPPSLYRAQCRMARAVNRMARGDALAEAANASGFTDQSHLSRAVKRGTGLSPRQLQHLLAAA